MRNPDYAVFLQSLLNDGWRSFYNGNTYVFSTLTIWGSIAAKLVDAIVNDHVQPGNITKDDLANYRSVHRKPLTTTWKGLPLADLFL